MLQGEGPDRAKAWRQETQGGTQRGTRMVGVGHGSVKRLSAVPSTCAVKRARDLGAGGSHS